MNEPPVAPRGTEPAPTDRRPPLPPPPPPPPMAWSDLPSDDDGHPDVDPRTAWLGREIRLENPPRSYRIDGLHPEVGAHAWVFIGTQLGHSDTQVAIKLRPVDTSPLARRLLYEFEVLQRIHTNQRDAAKNVIWPLGSDKRPKDVTAGLPEAAFVILAFIDGSSLRTRLDAGDLAPSSESRTKILRHVLLDVAAGIAAFHASDVVHRDIKPHNVVVARVAQGDTLATIVDAGLAKDMRNDALPPTELLAGRPVGGTKPYAPPEGWGSNNDPKRGDVYGLGLTLMEAVAGRPLAKASADVVGAVVTEAMGATDVPLAVRKALKQAMSFDAAERQADAVALLEELRRGYSDESSQVTPTATPPAAAKVSRSTYTAKLVLLALVVLAAMLLVWRDWPPGATKPPVVVVPPANTKTPPERSGASGGAGSSPQTVRPAGIAVRSDSVTAKSPQSLPVVGSEAPPPAAQWFRMGGAGDIRYHAAERLQLDCAGSPMVAVRGSWDGGLNRKLARCEADGWVSVSQRVLGLNMPRDAGQTYCVQIALNDYTVRQRQPNSGPAEGRVADTVLVHIADGQFGMAWQLVDTPASKLHAACASANRTPSAP